MTEVIALDDKDAFTFLSYDQTSMLLHCVVCGKVVIGAEGQRAHIAECWT